MKQSSREPMTSSPTHVSPACLRLTLELSGGVASALNGNVRRRAATQAS
jgi:hypothetical protein